MKLIFKQSVLFSLGLILFSCNSPKEKTEDSNLSYGQKLSKKTQSSRTKVLSPKEQLAGFKVPEGFVVELVASEEDGIVNPIDLTFDDAGRLWTQTASMYPLDPVANIKWKDLQKLIEDPEAQKRNPNFKKILDLYQGKSKGEDKILIISGLKDVKEVEVDVWADGLAIPQSIFPYKNGSFVAQGSELFFLGDTNNDGKADERTPVLTGFGFTDTHTMAHTMLRGPGDWIHFSHGALNKGEITTFNSDAKARIDYSKIGRFSLDGKKIEVASSGLNNIWGFQLRANGEWYGCEANDKGYSVAPMEVGTGFPGIGNDKIRSYQPFMPIIHEFRVGGTGISGLAFADDSQGSFPEEWKDVALLANPITSTINAVKIVRNPDGTVTSEHLPDLLSSEDDWFRPVNMEFGPDGALYIADWYNKIVSHNEVPTAHPDRDKSHGRIWRIRHKSQPLREVPNMYEVATNDLPSHLKSSSLWEKRGAWHQISDRSIEETKSLASELVALAADTEQDEITRIVTLWSLEGIRHYDEGLMKKLLSTDSDALRREAVRSLSSFSLQADVLAVLLKVPSEDKNAMVRSQVLSSKEDVLGGGYERNFERYLARKALEKYPAELWDVINSSEVSKYDATNLIWASQALPKAQRESVFVGLWKKAGYKELDVPTYIIVANMLDNKEINKAVKPILSNTKNAKQHINIALNNLSKVKSKDLAAMLTVPISYLLKSDDDALQQLGLKAVGELGISSLKQDVVSFLERNPSAQTITSVMSALENEPVQNNLIFAQLSNNEKLGVENRIKALTTYAKTDVDKAYAITEKWLPSINGLDQKTVAQNMANTSEGISLLKRLYKNKKIPLAAFTMSSAQKISGVNEQDVIGKEILNNTRIRLEEEEKNYTKKFERFMAIAEKEGGDPQKGEPLFQVCLMCHQVGNKGQEYAPSLDGAASRENEALLTAILNPDAAMESSYALYRVTKKDRSTTEGFLVKRDDNGTTIGFMGGSEQFIIAADIDSQQFIGGQSFMPKGLIDNYSDEQVANFLAYIRTLK